MTRVLVAVVVVMSGCGPVERPIVPSSAIPLPMDLILPEPEPLLHYCVTACQGLPPHTCYVGGD